MSKKQASFVPSVVFLCHCRRATLIELTPWYPTEGLRAAFSLFVFESISLGFSPTPTPLPCAASSRARESLFGSHGFAWRAGADAANYIMPLYNHVRNVGDFYGK